MTTPRSVLCGMLASLSLAACSSDENILREPRTEQSREFGEHDKIVARALSISNTQAMEKADSPYARALLCRSGVEVLAERIREAGGLGAQHVQAVEQVQAYFDQQLHTLASREGRSINDISRDLEQMALDYPDRATNARLAVSCLQELQKVG